ncbi:MAG: TonB-dependent receptor [Bacteroidetes bacterium]|nr:TonB-dependent receptor [Bacteroidota bacterium]
MKKIYFLLLSFFPLLIQSVSYSQQGVEGKVFDLPGVVITATRFERNMAVLPATVDVISKKQAEQIPANNVDDLLRTEAVMSVDRASGIFSKNASITMRGLNGSYRTLVLVDGIPINKADGGAINWSRLNVNNVERIEIVEGPNSALYGGNAMAGTINIITTRPEKKAEASVKVFGGSLNTIGGTAYIGGSQKPDHGLYWSVNTFYRKGDGYIITPESLRDSADAALFLKEYNVGGRVGYRLNGNNLIEAEGNFYDDIRGDGKKIYEGGYYKNTTWNTRLKYIGRVNKIQIRGDVFFQREEYFYRKESLKKDKLPPYGLLGYTWYDTQSEKSDYGMWLSVERDFTRFGVLTAGIDLKSGNVDGSDSYMTSTDVVTNKGSMDGQAVFVQDELELVKEKLWLTAGLRFDHACFHKGSFYIDQPTSVTSLLAEYQKNYTNTSRDALSPKLGIRYILNRFLSSYMSYGRGFRPPILDDMCRNGNVTKGLKLANPALKPEFLDNAEWGFHWKPLPVLGFQSTLFYSVGHDFQYFVGTGDSIFSGNTPKPVLMRENVGEVKIYGLELKANWMINKWLELKTTYSHTNSEITSFNLRNRYKGKDLKGKSLMEVSPDIFYSSLVWYNPWVNVYISYNYNNFQWADDENTLKNPDYSLVELKIRKDITPSLSLSIGVQNLLDSRYFDNKGNLGLPRYFIGSVSYRM